MNVKLKMIDENDYKTQDDRSIMNVILKMIEVKNDCNTQEYMSK